MPERDRPEIPALLGAALIMLLQALPAGDALEYRRALLAAEPWRALTAHLVHLNWSHAVVNAAAWLVLARLFATELDARRQLVCLLLAAPAVSVTLALAYPSIDWYRGASGILHALYFAGATVVLRGATRMPRRRGALALALALLAGGWVKVALELPGGGATPYAPWLGSTVVPQAHLAGAIAGTLFGALLRRRHADAALRA